MSNSTKIPNFFDKFKKFLIIIIAILMVLSGMNCIKNNKDKIFNYLDGKIENLIEEKVNNKLQEN